MKQITLIRGYVRNRLIPQLRVWISTLPETELEALVLLEGETGVRTAEKIAEYVLFALGHRPPAAQQMAAELDTALTATIQRGRPKLPERHGTSHQYKLGCRCDGCKAAMAVIRREYRAQRKAAAV